VGILTPTPHKTNLKNFPEESLTNKNAFSKLKTEEGKTNYFRRRRKRGEG
jgi:hypothetical protein